MSLQLFKIIYLTIETYFIKRADTNVDGKKILHELFVKTLFDGQTFEDILSTTTFKITHQRKQECLLSIITSTNWLTDRERNLIITLFDIASKDKIPQPAEQHVDEGAAEAPLPRIPQPCTTMKSAIKQTQINLKKKSPASKPAKLNLAVQFKSKISANKLDKHIAPQIKEFLTNVKSLEQFTCKGCNLCSRVIGELNITKCSKKHGGNPCNALGLNVHASKTYLTVLHATNQFVQITEGFRNPLLDEAQLRPEHDTTTNEICMETETTSNQCGKACSTRNTLKSFTRDYGDIEILKQVDKQKNRLFWKLHADTAASVYSEAAIKFQTMRKAGMVKPLPWWSAASKVLFLTGSVQSARDTAMNVQQRQSQKRDKLRLNKRKRT